MYLSSSIAYQYFKKIYDKEIEPRYSHVEYIMLFSEHNRKIVTLISPIL